MKKTSSRDYGAEVESKVLDFFLMKQFQLKDRNKKILGQEMDLILEKNQILYLIEVKSMQSLEWLETRWPLKQRLRFTKIASALSSTQKKAVRALFVVRLQTSGQIHIFENGEEITIS